MQRLAGGHASEFIEIDVTMPQAKVLYLLAATDGRRMSDLVQLLGVSLSTVSGLVDRVVDHGLVSRREDPADRRHVVVSLTPAGRDFVDRFRELNARQLRDLLVLLDDEGLDHVRRALLVLAAAADRLVEPGLLPSPVPPALALDRKDPA
jgi:DNA-binding MarR family transcriptional regulator